MRIARFRHEDAIAYGILDEGELVGDGRLGEVAVQVLEHRHHAPQHLLGHLPATAAARRAATAVATAAR